MINEEFVRGLMYAVNIGLITKDEARQFLRNILIHMASD